MLIESPHVRRRSVKQSRRLCWRSQIYLGQYFNELGMAAVRQSMMATIPIDSTPLETDQHG
jgi:hypothetical protein